MNTKWIIECRKPDGSLDSSGRQPEEVFGNRCSSNGVTDWFMSRVLFARIADPVLRGDNIPNWPALIDPRWVARKKTW